MIKNKLLITLIIFSFLFLLTSCKSKEEISIISQIQKNNYQFIVSNSIKLSFMMRDTIIMIIIKKNGLDRKYIIFLMERLKK